MLQRGVALRHGLSEHFYALMDELELGIDVPVLLLQLINALLRPLHLSADGVKLLRLELIDTDFLFQILDVAVFRVDNHLDGSSSRLAIDIGRASGE